MWKVLSKDDFDAWVAAYPNALDHGVFPNYETWGDMTIAAKWPHNVVAKFDGQYQVLAALTDIR